MRRSGANFATHGTWADQFGSRSFEMLWAFWGALGCAPLGAIFGVFLGVLPTDLPFLTRVVGCAGIGFICWYLVALVLGLVAIVGWIWEFLVALFDLFRTSIRRIGRD